MTMPPVMMNGAIQKAIAHGQQPVQSVKAYNYQTGTSPSKLARDQIGQRLAEMTQVDVSSKASSVRVPSKPHR